MYYQIDYGAGWENAHPDGYGMHETDCCSEECEGCWSPDNGDPEVWFAALADTADADRARCGYPGAWDTRTF